MRAIVGTAIALGAAIVASTVSIDVIGTGSPWVGVCAAAAASAWWCTHVRAAAACASVAWAILEVFLVWRSAEVALGQAAVHLATAALLAAAFSLTRRAAADNSATSQARSTPSGALPRSDEVNDED